MNKPALNYSDIWLVPEMSSLTSSSHADVTTDFLGKQYRLPVIPANMECVINTDIARSLSEDGYFYIMHRFGDTLKFVDTANNENWKLISISIGVKEIDRQLLMTIRNRGYEIDVITIDVAHGHHVLVRDQIAYIRHMFGSDVKVIAGNVVTPKAVEDLTRWGADAIKIGISGSSMCTTKHQTGFHIPMFTCVELCSYSSKVPLIADSGIREDGDIAKALVAGASMVMIGGMFGACIDSPAPFTVTQSIRNPVRHKFIHGSASAKQKGHSKNVEGVEVVVKCNEKTIKELLSEMNDALCRSISYAGGFNLEIFSSTKYVRTK